MLTRKCGRCKIEKPVSEFYKSTRDGYRSRCKPCHKEDCKLYAKTGYYQRPGVIERVKDYLSSPEVIERIKACDRAWRKEWRKRPDVAVKYFARTCLNNAIRAGRINREPCAMCGKEQSQGHHSDYSQPLLIVWLCGDCHRKLHKLSGGDNAD